jgi:hypothetical protein
MFLVHVGLVALLLAIVLLPRVFAIHYDAKSNSKSEEYEFDYR